MKNVALSMSNALTAIYPPFEFIDKKSVTKEQILFLNFRISMINQLLVTCLEAIDQNPSFWTDINLTDFKKYLTQNKAVIFDTQDYFNDGSQTMAILDNMKSNIRKIEEKMAKATSFNFDLNRMEERLDDIFHELPNEVTNVGEFRAWLKGIGNGKVLFGSKIAGEKTT
ncbi:hypothetical protein NYR60_05855 [Actinobacillus genomosp. 2]|uniref:hypothetical protein n=1 Tax=Actinobacillus genomosp. 2 TaxID=230709 RepID=UPI002442FEDE|nr:hypothetical protein [Actinobacillus genomosp. 2]WGE31399.1 hypothetical protein NYR60_05855 [Actinobacillus genomosp. 2]